jgi:hypothetical protein
MVGSLLYTGPIPENMKIGRRTVIDTKPSPSFKAESGLRHCAEAEGLDADWEAHLAGEGLPCA